MHYPGLRVFIQTSLCDYTNQKIVRLIAEGHAKLGN